MKHLSIVMTAAADSSHPLVNCPAHLKEVRNIVLWSLLHDAMTQVHDVRCVLRSLDSFDDTALNDIFLAEKNTRIQISLCQKQSRHGVNVDFVNHTSDPQHHYE